MPSSPPFVIVGTIGVMLVVGIAALGGDPSRVSETVQGILVWMIPGALIGAIAWGIASQVTGSIPLGAATGAATVAVYGFIRITIWLG